jgi:uncharacterized membrane protein
LSNSHDKFQIKDALEIIIGSVVLAYPIALTEEVWQLGYDLSNRAALFLGISSLAFQAVFVYVFFYYGKFMEHRLEFLTRLLSVWFLTIFVSGYCHKKNITCCLRRQFQCNHI